MSSSTHSAELLVIKLSNYRSLSAGEQLNLSGAIAATREFEANQDIVREGTNTEFSCLLLSGFAARYNVTVDGNRQITALLIPGDFIDLPSFLIQPIDHSITAVNHCSVALIPHSTLHAIVREQPELALLLWINTQIEANAHRRWSFVLGSLMAHQKLAHLLCELYLRMKRVNMTKDCSFHVPFTQNLVAECLGITSVHANRVTQMLRQQSLIRWERDFITILDWNRLAALGEFDGAYLSGSLADATHEAMPVN